MLLKAPKKAECCKKASSMMHHTSHAYSPCIIQAYISTQVASLQSFICQSPLSKTNQAQGTNHIYGVYQRIMMAMMKIGSIRE